MGGAYFSQPWRAVTASHQDNLDFVESYKPLNRDVKNLRIMLHGPVGSGKSSFINSVESALQGRITRRALTDTISRGYCTKKYTAYKIHKGRDRFYSFIFNDIMGFEKMTNRGVNVEDVKLAMKGHVPDGYKFDPEVQFQDDDDDYNSCPTLDDRVHVLVCVVPADNVSLMSPEVVKKMREVREAASEMGIPQLAILTKVDKAYPQLATDIKSI
ncbi:interferon-induced protein 44-like isoform X2 [Anoplopoma fimbria]|uniref:interferon-induced protein 44-like isoform X2 n=1 Tax=Anoplopoma fimbria TaxID=229290 RepID=UPI0023ED9EB0|nr:interferon-induced protein 44-like isoform X2 [Anoplopoma fimbria]